MSDILASRVALNYVGQLDTFFKHFLKCLPLFVMYLRFPSPYGRSRVPVNVPTFKLLREIKNFRGVSSSCARWRILSLKLFKRVAGLYIILY
jgi:hypothetical protein